MRVLQVAARFLPQVGGVERHVFEVATRLDALGIECEVLATDALGTLPAEEQMNGLRVRRVPAWPRGRDYHFAPGLVGKIRRGHWDVLHLQGIHTFVAPLAMAAARACGIPYVVTFHTGGHSSALRTRLRPWQWLLLRPLLRSAAQLVAVSEFEAGIFSHALRLRRSRFDVVLNGAEMPPLAVATRVDPNLIVSVGRVERYKGHHRLVEALPYVRIERPEARLRVVGDGPERGALLRRAAELGVGPEVRVEPIDAADRAAMTDLLGQAAVFALLSDYEAHPVAVMEALACGTPALVADTSGLTEIAARGWARAISPNADPRTVARALLDEMERGRRTPIALPTWSDTVNRLVAIYRRAAPSER